VAGVLTAADTAYSIAAIRAKEAIDDAAIDATLAFAARAGGRGSRLVFDFTEVQFEPALIERRTRQAGFSRFEATVAVNGTVHRTCSRRLVSMQSYVPASISCFKPWGARPSLRPIARVMDARLLPPP
jgi:hypothetical protein